MSEREIKFRVWDKESKKMHRPLIIFGEYSDLCGQADRVFWQDWDTNIEYEKFEWMQYTNLHDKNGKEVYERDIVKTRFRGMEYIGEVIFVRGCFAFKWIKGEPEHLKAPQPFCVEAHHKVDFEVIGNIHENPELLEGEARLA